MACPSGTAETVSRTPTQKQPYMFENQPTPLELDQGSKDYLRTTVKWTTFLSIVGFITLGLSLIGAVGLFTAGSRTSPMFAGNAQMQAFNTLGWIGMGIIYVAVILLCFYPVYALFKFSSGIKRGVAGNDPVMIREGFRHQRNLYIYLGILTLITLIFYLIMFLLGLVISTAA